MVDPYLAGGTTRTILSIHSIPYIAHALSLAVSGAVGRAWLASNTMVIMLIVSHHANAFSNSIVDAVLGALSDAPVDLLNIP